MRTDLNFAESRAPRVREGLMSGGKEFVVYHRTGSTLRDLSELEMLARSIMKGGFKAGSGDMYGRGFYSTGDFLSQFGMRGNNNMGGYGMAIIKYAVPTDGLFVFDYRVAKKIYGNAYTLVDQYCRIARKPESQCPEVIKILSDDLEQTFTNPKLSASRAAWFWGDFCYRRKCDIRLFRWSALPSLPDDVAHGYDDANGHRKGYADLEPDDFKWCDIYRLRGSTGVVYSGTSDGNCVFVKEEASARIKPIAYCVMDPSKSDDPKAFVVGWTLALSKSSAFKGGCLVDVLEAAGIPKAGSSFRCVWAEGYPKNGGAAAVDFISRNFPWTASPACKFSNLDAAFLKGGRRRFYALGGEWTQGKCDARYFGALINIPTRDGNDLDAVGCDRRYVASFGDPPIFRGGEMSCDLFYGDMRGGVFRRGEFHGVFSGGLLDLDGGVEWENDAKMEPSTPTSCAIKKGGKIYKIGRATPDEFLAALAAGAGAAGVSSLSDAIMAALAFKAERVDVADNWHGAKSVAAGLAEFKRAYPWLFNKVGAAVWLKPPVIAATDSKLICKSGVLGGRDAYFDVWENDAVVGGGVVRRASGKAGGGATEFHGSFNGGVFEGGKFCGTFNAGVLGVDALVWDPGAKWLAGNNPRFMVRGKVVSLDPRALMLPDARGNIKYAAMADIIAGVKSGAIMDDLRKFDKAASDARKAGLPPPQLATVSARKGKLDVGITQGAIDASLARMAADKEWGMDESVASVDMSEAMWALSGGMSRLDEREFAYAQLSDEEQDRLYDVFRDTYTRVVGAAFSRPDFDWRAAGWTFYGEPPDDSNPQARVGGISVRRQQSNNMYRLTSSFGHPMAVLKGFAEFTARHGRDPSWGAVTPDIARMIAKRDKSWRTIPGPVLKAMESGLNRIMNGEVRSVGINGVMKVDTPAGAMDKLFIANKAYIEWLLDSIENPANARRLPVAQALLKPLVGLLRALL